MDAELIAVAERLAHTLRQAGLSVVTAESCTGGWLGAVLTAIPGSSLWYERGFITYSNAAKREALDVRTETLSRFGAVSEQTARAMVEGALAHSHADLAVAITGIAGPGGGSAEKPVGTVCFAWGGRRRPLTVVTRHFAGDRVAVRRAAVNAALLGLLELAESPENSRLSKG